jgi:Na+/melibiose symporter-like transporter
MKPDLLRLAFAQICLTLGPGWMSNLYLFYFGGVLGFSVPESSALLLVYILAGLGGAPLAVRLAGRFGKHRALLGAAAGYSIGLCTVLLLPHDGNVLVALPTMAWCGATAAGFNMMILAMMADVGDEIRLEQGKERLSLIFAINGVVAKIASAASLAIAFPLLKQIGFEPAAGANNSAEALDNLQVIYIAGPIFFVMLGGACVLGWRLSAARHDDIRRALAEKDVAADGA